jgi:hypothetical protein
LIRLLSCLSIALAASLPSLAEDEGALKLYRKAVRNMNSSEGYHLESKIDVDMGGTSMPGGSVEGVIRNPDFGHFKVDLAGNALDLFKEGDCIALMNPQTGQWESQAGNQTLDFFVRIFNLGALLDQFAESVEEAEFGDPEDIGKLECRTVDFGVPQKTLKSLISGNGKDSLGVSAENAKMALRAWIDRKKSLPRRIRIVIDVELKGLPGAGEGEDWEEWEEDEKKDEKKDEKTEGEKDGGEAEGEEEIPPMKISITVTAGIKKYGQELDVEVPKEARKVLDAQKTEKSGPKDPESGKKDEE